MRCHVMNASPWYSFFLGGLLLVLLLLLLLDPLLSPALASVALSSAIYLLCTFLFLQMGDGRRKS